MSRDKVRKKVLEGLSDIIRSVKWVLIAVCSGIACGVAGGLFVRCLSLVTGIREDYPFIMVLLPVGGMLILLFYHLLRDDESKGVNIVISSIQSGHEIPVRTAPAIFISSIFSHLCGASVGREGAALQLGGSIGHAFSRIFRMKQENSRIMVMSGMAGAFSAVFGTPVTAVFFSMEVTSIGHMSYSALLPCVAASFTGREVARYWFGVQGPFYCLQELPAAGFSSMLAIFFLSVCCGLVSIMLCVLLRQTAKLGRRYLPNRYLRSLFFGSILLLLTWLTGGKAYNGTGAETIAVLVEQAHVPGRLLPVHWYSFLMKMLFTALSLAAGYKGGEIVPTFFIGSSFGYWFGTLIGFSPNLCAAAGLGALFCGVTNAPVASVFLCIELFGVQGLVFYVPAIAIAYIASSYYGLYPAQKIIFSKYGTRVVNEKTR